MIIKIAKDNTIKKQVENTLGLSAIELIIYNGAETPEGVQEFLDSIPKKGAEYAVNEIFSLVPKEHYYPATRTVTGNANSGGVNGYHYSAREVNKKVFKFSGHQLSIIDVVLSGAPKEHWLPLSRTFGWYKYIKTHTLRDLKRQKETSGGFKKTAANIIKYRLRELANQKLTDSMKEYIRLVKEESQKDIADAKFVLEEAISVYRACREDRNHAQALKALEVIGKHIDVDAFVSNRVTIEQNIDYANMLEMASERALEAPMEFVKPIEIEVKH